MRSRSPVVQFPDPIVGVTFDDVSKSSSEVAALQSLAKFPTVRVVIDKGEAASYYKGPMTAFHPYAFIMAELVDDSYMAHYTLSSVQSLVASYTWSLGNLVDIWEVGNEVNGNWLSKLSNGSDVMPKIGHVRQRVELKREDDAHVFLRGRTEGSEQLYSTRSWRQRHVLMDTCELHQCSDRGNGEDPAGRGFCFHKLVPRSIPGEMPNWGWVYNELAQIFPKKAASGRVSASLAPPTLRMVRRTRRARSPRSMRCRLARAGSPPTISAACSGGTRPRRSCRGRVLSGRP